MEGTESDTPSLTSALDGVGGQSTVHSGRFTHGNDPVPTVWEAEWYGSKDKVSWTDRVSIEEVLRRVKEARNTR
jgi:hypothetical protein